MRVVLPAGVNLTVWKHAVPRNRMRETFTSGSVGGLVEQSLILPGQPTWHPCDWSNLYGLENRPSFKPSLAQCHAAELSVLPPDH